MKRIQVTNVHIDSRAQVILPNCYFISKTVRAMLANDALKNFFTEAKANGQDVGEFIMDDIKTIDEFLHELVDALEGNEE